MKNLKAFLRKRRGRKAARLIEIQRQKPPFGKYLLIFSCLVGTARWHHLKTLAMTEQYIKVLYNIGSFRKNVPLNSLSKGKFSLPAPL